MVRSESNHVLFWLELKQYCYYFSGGPSKMHLWYQIAPKTLGKANVGSLRTYCPQSWLLPPSQWALLEHSKWCIMFHLYQCWRAVWQTPTPVLGCSEGLCALFRLKMWYKWSVGPTVPWCDSPPVFLVIFPFRLSAGGASVAGAVSTVFVSFCFVFL